jgi:hypothetical protein
VLHCIDDLTGQLIRRWRDDHAGTYRTWFLWEERLKSFRSIRRGLAKVAEEIEAGTFGNAYRGSSLETVVGAIAERRQIFKGQTTHGCGSRSSASRISTSTTKIGASSDACWRRAFVAWKSSRS